MTFAYNRLAHDAVCRGGVHGEAPISMVGMLFMSDATDAVTKAMPSVELKAYLAQPSSKAVR